jgi:FlaA1/EpsC-like NDP-sugar epimerase
VAVHIVIFVASYLGAFLIRFDFDLGEVSQFWEWTPIALATLVVAKGFAFAIFRQYSGWWRYVSLDDLLGITKATVVGTMLGAALIFALGLRGFPRSIPLLDGMLTLATLALLRVSIRLVRERVWRHGDSGFPDRDAIRTLIVGTGPNAEGLIREIHRSPQLSVKLAGLICADKRLVGTRLSGCPILGHIDDLVEIANDRDIEQVIVAVENGDNQLVREIHDLCLQAGVQQKLLPTTDALLDGTASFSRVREVDLRDLLGRPPVSLENEGIARAISGRTVLVTGAGGSIGSELCRQVARFGPSQLVLVEQAENPLFHLERSLVQDFPDVKLRTVVADIYDNERMYHIMDHTGPSLVLHAAAHKHVPLMEQNPSEAIKNNVIGTLNVISAAQSAEVDRCVLISTDKAVNPTSVMGASKRIAEMLAQSMAPRSQTRLAAVRFGNVLGSNGSVIPIFKQQISTGGPVTVTHPDMRRFFMTIPEASQLVLQAATFADSGDIFVLDMGEPVKILDIARDLIRLSGFDPDGEIPIKFTGIRPGEKLFEELATNEEEKQPTQHSRIFRATVEPPCPKTVQEAALQLEKLARSKAPAAQLRKIIFDTLERLEARASIEEVRSVTDEHSTVVAFNAEKSR